jgi:hypothetical protein
MTLIEKRGEIEIWAVEESYGTDFYVYGVMASGPRVVPSIDMARAAAAKGAAA